MTGMMEHMTWYMVVLPLLVIGAVVALVALALRSGKRR